MADPLASWMWTRLTEPPPHDDHAVVDVDTFVGATEVEKTLLLDSSGAEGQRGHEDIPEDVCLPPISSRQEVAGGYDHDLHSRLPSSHVSSWQVAGYDSWLSSPPLSRDGADDVKLEHQISSKMDRVRGSEDQPYIWKVPPGIRDHDKEAYEPKLISIGPLHHGREMSLPMEELKLMYLRDLLGRSQKHQISSYIRVIRDIELRARKQYSESLRSLRTDAFVMMLVVDGCFIIECFLKKFFSKRQVASSTVRWRLSHLRRDLMLFENQIPFFVLVALFNECSIPLITGTHHGSISLIEIVLEFLKIKLPRDKYPEAHQVHHLLHLHHLCLDPSLSLDASRSGCPYRRLILNRLEDAAIMISLILLSLPFLLLIRKPPWSWFSNGQAETPRMIPCATELEKAGVRFQKKVFKEGELNCYLKVLFVDGILEIPFLPVDESTGSELRNFITLEQCCPELGNHFTSYAVLMDNIINTEMDVTLLRNHRIIEKRLGSDAQVADMFNKLCKGTYLSYKGHYNEQLYKEVNAYCDVPHHKWRASLMGTYFGNPWSIISLVAGIFLSALSIIQTYFTITRHPQ